MSLHDPAIYHIAHEADLRSGIEAGVYRPASLAEQGFVHCATGRAVAAVANDYFSEADGRVVVLEIDPMRLRAETRYEAPVPIAGGGRSHLDDAPMFPHVYGPIDLDAIRRVGVLEWSPGGYVWPPRFTLLEAFIASE